MNLNAPPPSGPPARSVTAAVIEDGGRVLVARRKKGDRFEGRWEFPGGKVEPDESPEESLKRELREEMGIEVAIGEPLGTYPFRAREELWELLAYRARIIAGTVVCHDHDEARWVEPAELEAFDLTDPDRLIVLAVFGDGKGRFK